MLLDVSRFNLFGLDLVTDAKAQNKIGASQNGNGHPTSGETGQTKTMDVDEADESEISIGEYLEKEGYGEGFKEDYLLVSVVATCERGNRFLLKSEFCVAYDGSHVGNVQL